MAQVSIDVQRPSSPSPSPNNINVEEQNKKKKKVSLVPLIFLIFFEVSGGPYGEEPAVQAAGPLLAILGFVVFPFIWSVPEALITAELATAFPGNGGYVLWADAAFGPLAAHLMGSCKYLSGVINNAAYPVLFADYLSRPAPSLSSGGLRRMAIAGFTLLLSFVNYLGLAVVGYGAVAVGVAAMAPIVVMVAAAAPKIRVSRWGAVGNRRRRTRSDWSLYFNTLFWNLNFWDNASTLAGEVEEPQKTYPAALFAAGLLTCVGYLLPLLAATGALELEQDRWTDGFLAEAAGKIAGKWLQYWVTAGSAMSAVGLYEAQLSSCGYQLLGMADAGLLPKAFASRARWFDTPWLAIATSTAITLAVSFMDFADIISAANLIYGLSMLLEFAAFVWLRRKLPLLERPFRVPLGVPALVCMCLVPAAFLVFVMTIGTWKVYAIGFGLSSVGLVVYLLTKWADSTKSWLTKN